MDNRALCLRYLMGDASPEEVATLSEWIAESPENAQAFALLSAQDAYLATAVANRCKPEGEDTLLLEELAAIEQAAGPAQLVDLTDEVMAQQKQAKQAQRAAKRNKAGGAQGLSAKEQVVLVIPKAVVWLGLAAAVVLAGTLLFYLTEPAGNTNDVATNDQVLPEPEPIFAGIVRSLDPQWQDADDSAGSLKQGVHTLTQGVVELELLSGTRVVVQSPATFELTGINTMSLDHGRAVFTVSNSSTSFILDTPNARFVKADAGLSISDRQTPDSRFIALFRNVSLRPGVTEFGVHVEADQQTHAQVFRGQIQASTKQDRDRNIAPIALGESQAVVISGDGMQDVAYDELAFEREVTTSLQLVDMIMGGDGTTRRENVGLHPVTGQYERNIAGNRSLIGLLSTGRLQPVPGSAVVKGTFIPSKDGRLDGLPVGLTLPGLPETNGIGYGVIWSGAEMPALDQAGLSPVPTKLPGYNFAGAGQQSMVMHTNAGLMIDLDAIRSANPGFEIVAIKAVVGNASQHKPAEKLGNKNATMRSDFLAYLDSDLAMSKAFDLSADEQERVALLELSIQATHRYLTLVSSDGGDGNHQDWIVLGNPIVVLRPIEQPINDF